MLILKMINLPHAVFLICFTSTEFSRVFGSFGLIMLSIYLIWTGGVLILDFFKTILSFSDFSFLKHFERLLTSHLILIKAVTKKS